MYTILLPRLGVGLASRFKAKVGWGNEYSDTTRAVLGYHGGKKSIWLPTSNRQTYQTASTGTKKAHIENARPNGRVILCAFRHFAQKHAKKLEWMDAWYFPDPAMRRVITQRCRSSLVGFMCI